MDFKLNLVHSLYLACKFFLSDELVQMIEEFLFLVLPLCSREVRKIVYDFAQANGFEGLSKDSSEAGQKWFGFLLKQYPKLRVKEGVTNLSIATAKASDHDSVTRWYKKYQNVLDQLEITDPKYI